MCYCVKIYGISAVVDRAEVGRLGSTYFVPPYSKHDFVVVVVVAVVVAVVVVVVVVVAVVVVVVIVVGGVVVVRHVCLPS